MSETVEQLTARSLPLAGLHAQHGATMVERDGWLLPAHYGDAAAEYEAVRGGAGLFDLSERGRVEVSGAEAVQFLNGLVTNDVKALAPGAWMNAAFPNAQGRLLALALVGRVLGAEAALVGRTRAAVVPWNAQTLTLLRATHTGEDGFDLIAGPDVL